jgi:hypothetical protein
MHTSLFLAYSTLNTTRLLHIYIYLDTTPSDLSLDLTQSRRRGITTVVFQLACSVKTCASTIYAMLPFQCHLCDSL